MGQLGQHERTNKEMHSIHYTDMILDSGNAMLGVGESRPWEWARRERHAALAATFAPQENFRGSKSAGKHVARKAHCTALAGDH